MKALLLNSSFEPLSFVPLKRLIKLVVNNKVEIMDFWDEYIHWGAGKMKFPAIVRLKYYVNRPPIRKKFNIRAVFARDMYQCLYCGISLTPSKITVDHIVPKSRGGILTWLNAASSCEPCNTKKANKTPEEAGMKLLKKPYVPEPNLYSEYKLLGEKHISWNDYFTMVES